MNEENLVLSSELLDYFDGDELAAKVWIGKYALKDSSGTVYEETPKDMHWRMAKEIARIEENYPNPMSPEEIFQLLDKFKYVIPQGGPMTGIGNNFQVASLSNCFVIGNEADSYGGIIRIDEEQVHLMKRRGGVGHDLSHIRPKGSPVKNSALTSTGLVPFMERYSNSTREVAQDGRRGALMLSVSVNHPDVEDFIDAKMEQGKVTGANISVRITDEFMQAVDNANNFTHKYPVDSTNPTITREASAESLWEKIVHNAWKSAEPGVLFWDTITRESVADCYAHLGFRTVSTNPCFTGDMTLLTSEGYKTFYELQGTSPTLFNELGEQVVGKVWSNGTKDTVRVRLSSGRIIKSTPDHRYKLVDGTEEIANNLKGKALMPFMDVPKYNNLFTKLGFIQGDASIADVLKGSKKGFTIHIGEKDGEILDLFGFEKKGRHYYTDEYVEYLDTYGFNVTTLPYRNLPSKYYDLEDADKLAFLQGLFSANGSVISKTRVSLKTTSAQLAEELLEALEEFGIEGYITTNKSKVNTFYNGDYTCRESYDVNIHRYESLLIFANKIGFVHNYKNESLKEVLLVRSPKVTSVQPDGKREVFDFNLSSDNHWGVVEGRIVHNCGEIPLCPYDSCRLLAVNLYSYVVKPFTPAAQFNWKLFEDHVAKAMRIMDDIIDLEIEKIDAILTKIKSDPEDEEVKRTEIILWERIKEKTIQGRRTGLGITAEGDMLAALGIRYGSEEGNDFSEEVHKTLAIEAVRASVKLAKERGSFPIYDSELEKDNPFINRIREADPKLYDEMDIHGRRNISLLTIAPTGTTSLMSQTTSGIEPVFNTAYKRRRKINPNDKNAKVDFIDVNGDTWEEFIVYHPKFKMWMELEAYDTDSKWTIEELQELTDKSPYYKSTANDVDWLMKVKMQGRVQKWVDHSISVTINLPEDATEELVSQLYMEAWKSGCKGVTVYREGSRDGVLVSLNNKGISPLPADRPDAINCEILRFRLGKEQWIAFIGLVDGHPYELFTGINNLEVFPVPVSVNAGVIVKVPTDNGSRYDFKYEDVYGNINTVGGLNTIFNREYWNYARFTSALMREGAEVENIVNIIDKLDSPDDSLNTWKAGVMRALRQYILNGTKPTSKSTCPQCKETEYLEYKEGCLTCTNCGNSNCS